MNKSQRIRTTLDGTDKYLQVKLEQNVDFLEILSLKIDQEQAYQFFNSDYGVLVGRVLANGGVGIPNAKISIFIPLSDDDELDPKIKALYPYKSPQDKNLDGKRYNLLPRVGKVTSDGTFRPKQPFGTFPPKEEIIANETYLEIYEKYYKFTTVSNGSGDYMIFGIPVGIQTVHLSVDITDIGIYSMSPAAMVTNLGYSSSLFTDNNTKIKPSSDLGDLPNIETQEIAVDIRPFWGDSENYEIGITRQDFKIRAILQSTFTVFGSAFTDNLRGTWGQNDIQSGDDYTEMWRINNDGNANLGITVKRIGTIKTRIFYIPPRVSDADINSGNFDTTNDVLELNEDEYTSFIDKGQFIYIISCNRRKIVTDEFGNEQEVSADSSAGIFSEFRGMFYCDYGEGGELETPKYGDISGDKYDDHTFFGQRWKMKIPQWHPDDITDTNNKFNSDFFNPVNALYGNAAVTGGIRTHGKEGNAQRLTNNENWRKMNFKFSASKYYSVAKHHQLVWKSDNLYDNIDTGTDPFWNTGTIATSGGGDLDDNNPDSQFPHNSLQFGTSFGGQWLNFCLYFPQHTFFHSDDKPSKSNSNPVSQDNGNDGTMYGGNTIKLISKVNGTGLYLRNDFHKTMFVEVPREDLVIMLDSTLNGTTTKGFKINSSNPIGSDSPYNTNPLIGSYMYRNRTNTNPTVQALNTNISYFYKGHDVSDCILFLNSKSLI